MIGLQDLYTKFSNTAFKGGLKPARNALSTPPFTFLGNINTSNLAPLQSDTVSFTGISVYDKNKGKLARKADCPKTSELELIHTARKAKKQSSEDDSSKKMDYRAFGLYREVLPVASEVHEQAKKLEKPFELKMCVFDSLVNGTGKFARSKPIAKKETRVKSTQSIAKKTAAKLSELVGDDYNYNIQVSPIFIKSKIHDLLGARLILTNGSPAEMNSVINRLIELMENSDKPIKIKSIKNYGSHPYLSPSKLDKLESASYKVSKDFPEVANKKKISGYTATHIVFEMNNGIDAEIQILGRGVARVKEIEDICYKGLQGKAISGLPEVSKALKAISKDDDRCIEYYKYIASAYDTARAKWDKMPDEELKKQKFHSIDTKKFPACLDLNNIEAELKEQALRKKRKGY